MHTSDRVALVPSSCFRCLLNSANDERQLKAVMEFRKAYSAQALEGSNIPKVMPELPPRWRVSAKRLRFQVPWRVFCAAGRVAAGVYIV